MTETHRFELEVEVICPSQPGKPELTITAAEVVDCLLKTRGGGYAVCAAESPKKLTANMEVISVKRLTSENNDKITNLGRSDWPNISSDMRSGRMTRLNDTNSHTEDHKELRRRLEDLEDTVYSTEPEARNWPKKDDRLKDIEEKVANFQLS